MNDTEKLNMNDVSEYKGIPAMTSPIIHEYLREIGRHWTGKGVAMELGCWLGASSAALLNGLKESGYDKTYWAFDRWIANNDQVVKAAKVGVILKNDQPLTELYIENVSEHAGNIGVNCVKGLLPKALDEWQQDHIEIVLFDAPKAEPVFSGCMNRLMPHFIPGVTIIGLLDYKFYERHSGAKREKFFAPVKYMEGNKRFEKIMEWDDQCPVFFRYLG